MQTGIKGLKLTQLRLARSKNAYGIIVKHVSDVDLIGKGKLHSITSTVYITWLSDDKTSGNLTGNGSTLTS